MTAYFIFTYLCLALFRLLKYNTDKLDESNNY